MNPLVAILVYALIAWVLVKIVGLVMGDYAARRAHDIEPDRHACQIDLSDRSSPFHQSGGMYVEQHTEAKDTGNDVKNDVKDALHDAKNDVKDAAHDVKNKIKDAAHDVKNDVKDTAHDAKNDAKDAARDARSTEAGQEIAFFYPWKTGSTSGRTGTLPLVEPVQMSFAPGLSVRWEPGSDGRSQAHPAPNVIRQSARAAFHSGPFCYVKSIVTADDRATPFCYAYEWEEERFSSGAPRELHAVRRGDYKDAFVISVG